MPVPRTGNGILEIGYLAGLEPGLRDAVITAAARMAPVDQIASTSWAARWAATPAARSAIGTPASGQHRGLTDPADDATNIAWARDSWATIQPFTTGGYLNFLAGDDADRVRSAYNPATWTRLQEVEHDWDPNNVFHINHNIRPGKEG